MRTKRIVKKALDNLKQQSNKKIHTFSLDPDVMLEFKKTCEGKYSMSQVVEELIKAFIETRKEE